MNIPIKILLNIHDAIHDNSIESINIEGTQYDISTVNRPYGYGIKSMVRRLRYKGITFVEQDPEMGSVYGGLARAGHKVTWGMRSGANWILIVDDEVKQR